MLAAQAASACHLNWIALGSDQRPIEDDSRQPGMWEQLQRVTDAVTKQTRTCGIAV